MVAAIMQGYNEIVGLVPGQANRIVPFTLQQRSYTREQTERSIERTTKNNTHGS
jgi:hypothetical protein